MSVCGESGRIASIRVVPQKLQGFCPSVAGAKVFFILYNFERRIYNGKDTAQIIFNRGADAKAMV